MLREATNQYGISSVVFSSIPRNRVIEENPETPTIGGTNYANQYLTQSTLLGLCHTVFLFSPLPLPVGEGRERERKNRCRAEARNQRNRTRQIRGCQSHEHGTTKIGGNAKMTQGILTGIAAAALTIAWAVWPREGDR